MRDTKLNIREIFSEAIGLPSPNEVDAYLDDACGDKPELRAEVQALIESHRQAGNFLGGEARSSDSAGDLPSVGYVGTAIGPYIIRELIGEGGMGEVYVAEQTEPVRRKVALKIIKPGMATKDVIARFEAERQALAMMDHPNIAKVFDGGVVGSASRAVPGATADDDHEGPARLAAPSGHQPYFVMELVLGVPITDYCDEHQLTTRQRLELFLKICQAVHHAHQKGIIHRDIKPGNVLVAEIDGAAVPKVIDFGVAKAINQKLTKDTVYTNVSQMIGTPLYMSPEQATLGIADVDTRSDVYSLGVLLYELLTGQTPFDRETLKQAAFEEIQRIIREDEPPRPSAMVSTLKADALSTVCEKRRSDPRRLSDSLRGELDWIVMKALDKDRNRRYESANELARDVDRYLADEPVHACPPSATYRLRKFVRKHRTGVLSAVAVVLTLAVGVVFTTLSLARAVAERNRAQVNLQRGCDLIEYALEETYRDVALAVDPERLEYRDRLLNRSIEFFESLDQVARIDPRVRHGMARAYRDLGFYQFVDGKDGMSASQRAVDLLTQLTAEYPLNAEYRISLAKAVCNLGGTHWSEGRYRNCAVERGRSAAILRQAVQEFPADVDAQIELVRCAGMYGEALHACGRLSEAQNQFSDALDVIQGRETWTRKGGGGFSAMTTHRRFAPLLIELGRYDAAAEQIEKATRLAEEGMSLAATQSRRILAESWLALAESDLGHLHIIRGEPENALILLRNASLRIERIRNPSSNIWGEYWLGQRYLWQGWALAQLLRYEDAIAAHEQAQTYARSTGIPVGFALAARSQAYVGELHHQLGRRDERDQHLAAALRELNANAAALPGEPSAIEPLVVFLCMCPNPTMRDLERAVALAETLTEQCESSGPFWRYLGLARYRTGDLAGSEEAIKTSMQLRNGGDTLDLLLLALTLQHDGRQDEALEAYRHAERLILDNQPIYYGYIGVLGFERIRSEVKKILRSDR